MPWRTFHSSWRRAYTRMLAGWVGLLALLLPVLNAVGHLSRVDLWFWLVSLAVCLVVLLLVRVRAPLATVNRVMLALISGWTFSRLLLDVAFLHGVRPATIVMVDALVALAFAFLNRSGAVLFALFSGLALLSGGLSHAGADWEALIFNLFTLAVIGYMSVYGQDIRAARLQAEQAERMLDQDEETGLYTPQAAQVLLEAIAVQAEGRGKPLGVMLVRPRHLPWVTVNDARKPPQPAFALLAQRLKSICSNRDLVALWGEQSFIVGVREVDAAQLATRAQALKRAMGGAYWVGGPVLQVDVVSRTVTQAEGLDAELKALENASADLVRASGSAGE